jgi:tripartite-type tricarboxylate transporter receptor subunit TctC
MGPIREGETLEVLNAIRGTKGRKARGFFVSLCMSVLAAAAGVGQAQTYPSRPVRMVVALAPGGPTDVVARIYGAKLSEFLGQQIVVDNRPGAGGSVAGEIVARSPADGHTLFVAANGTIAIAPNLLFKLPYSVARDLAPVALIGNSPFVVMVHPGFPAKTMQTLLVYANTHPGKINFGSAGQGSTSQLAAELLKMMAQIKMTHVPYKGAGPALIGTVAGEIDLLISGVSTGLPFIRQEKLRGLAVTSTKRLTVLPELPPVAEIVPGYEAASWYAVMVPAATPRTLVDRLNRDSIGVIRHPDVSAKLASQGVDPEPLSPEQLADKIRVETMRWGKVVKAAGVKAQ